VRGRVEAGGIWLAAFCFYLVSASPGSGLEDAGELVASALTLSNAHMPGYPLFSLLGRLFALLPAGAPGFRVGLASAVAGASAALFAWMAARDLAEAAGATGPARSAAGWMAAGAAALAPSSWWQASMPEKFAVVAALHGAALAAFLRHYLKGGAGRLLGAMMLSGLALSHHLMGLYLVPLAGWALWKRGGGGRARLLAALLFLLPLTIKAVYPPVRASAGAMINWGVPDKAERLVSYLGVGVYRGRMMGLSDFREMGARAVSHVVRVPATELLVALVLVPPGFVFLWRGAGPVAAAVAVLLGVNLAVAVTYRVVQITQMYLTMNWTLAVLAGLGLGQARERWRAAPALGIACLLVQLWRGASFAPQDRRFTGLDHARNIIASTGVPAVLVAHNDSWLFPLWEAQVAGGEGRDLLVVTRRHLDVFSPEHALLANLPFGRHPALAAHQGGLAMLWEMARVAKPLGVFVDAVGVPAPSRGAEFRGVAVRITEPGREFGVDAADDRLWRRFRLRSIAFPVSLQEATLASYYARYAWLRGDTAYIRASFREALAAAERGLRIQPGNPALHELKGRALIGLKKRDDARREFLKALDLSFGFSLDAHFGLAAALGQMGDQRGRLDSLRDAGVMGGRAASLLVEAGNRARDAGRTREAEIAYIKAAAVAFTLRGMTDWASERFLESWLDFRRAMGLDPGLPQPLYQLGLLAESEERWKDAADWYRKASRKDPRVPEPAEALERIKAAEEWSGRVNVLHQAFLQSRLDAGSWCDMGNAFWLAGRPVLAEWHYLKALRLDPRLARAWYNLGAALVRQERLGEAERAYSRAVVFKPDYREAWGHLAFIRHRMGDRKGAVKAVRRAMDLSPGDPRVEALYRTVTGETR
jgi:tetratricopeptide (TPR) repeat protein